MSACCMVALQGVYRIDSFGKRKDTRVDIQLSGRVDIGGFTAAVYIDSFETILAASGTYRVVRALYLLKGH